MSTQQTLGSEFPDYCSLLARLAAKAHRMGLKDPESAAQEVIKRSLSHPEARAAIEFYCADRAARILPTPVWPEERLLAWLHGVLTFVAREQYRASDRERRRLGRAESIETEPRDPTPDQLEALIQRQQTDSIVAALSRLRPEYRSVLRYQSEGLSYKEIADKMRTTENMVATWVLRARASLKKAIAEHE
jgi:RNA polymerase sigma factor (sigma-70 family)